MIKPIQDLLHISNWNENTIWSLQAIKNNLFHDTQFYLRNKVMSFLFDKDGWRKKGTLLQF